ncbi:hypothetical protein FJZ53_01140 [Candidatus Woesearchaeota archaeon]|nr:hypothetical protein [Candidatus Woesearchaeota archaeon]
MKIPESFIPEKSLDDKTGNFVKGFSIIPCTIDELIRDQIGDYNKNKEYYPDKSLAEYKHVPSAVECASIYYGYRNPEIIRVTIFRFDKPAKDFLNEITDEIFYGHFQINENIYYMIKNKFAMIITTVEDTLEEQEAFKTFIGYYRKLLKK